MSCQYPEDELRVIGPLVLFLLLMWPYLIKVISAYQNLRLKQRRRKEGRRGGGKEGGNERERERESVFVKV